MMLQDRQRRVATANELTIEIRQSAIDELGQRLADAETEVDRLKSELEKAKAELEEYKKFGAHLLEHDRLRNERDEQRARAEKAEAKAEAVREASRDLVRKLNKATELYDKAVAERDTAMAKVERLRGALGSAMNRLDEIPTYGACNKAYCRGDECTCWANEARDLLAASAGHES